MTHNINNRHHKVHEFFGISILFGIALLLQHDAFFSEEQNLLFIVLFAGYIWIVVLLLYGVAKYDLHLLEPISFISVLYICIFIVKPVVDIRSGSMIEHGIDVMQGGIKATLLFLSGYTAFFMAYLLHSKPLAIQQAMGKRKKQRPRLLKELYFSWAVVYALCIYCMLTQGMSIKYIFSFGTEGERIIDESNTALLFLSNFGITLVALWLLIMDASKNIWIKSAITILSIVYILMRNSRWLMLVFIAAPIMLYCIKRQKQLKLSSIFAIGALAVIVFAWMQANRYALSTGGAMSGWGEKGFSLKTLLAPFETELSTYRTFYSMVTRYPSQYGYMLGKTFLYVFLLFIPRSIWKGKPDNPAREMIENSLNSTAKRSGTACANIGEFYVNFGILGVLGCMYLLGWAAAQLKNYCLLREPDEEACGERQVMYCILYPLMFQWIARGNFSGNFYLTLFAVLPFILIRFFRTREGD